MTNPRIPEGGPLEESDQVPLPPPIAQQEINWEKALVEINQSLAFLNKNPTEHRTRIEKTLETKLTLLENTRQLLEGHEEFAAWDLELEEDPDYKRILQEITETKEALTNLIQTTDESLESDEAAELQSLSTDENVSQPPLKTSSENSQADSRETPSSSQESENESVASAPVSPHKGILTRFRERRQMRAIAKNIDQLYGETIESLGEHIRLAKTSHGEHQNIIAQKDKLEKTLVNLSDALAVYLNNLNEKYEKKKSIDTLQEITQTESYLVELTNLKRTLAEITHSSFKLDEVSFFGKIHRFDSEASASKALGEFINDPNPKNQVTLSGEAPSPSKEDAHTHLESSDQQNYWYSYTFKTSAGEIKTVTRPTVDENQSLNYQIVFNDDDRKKISALPSYSERTGLTKTKIPNPDVVLLARDQIESYRADKKYNGSTIYISGNLQDKQILLAMQLYCQLKGYSFVGTPDLLNRKTVEKEVKAMEHVLTQKSQSNEAKPLFGSNFGMSAKHEEALTAKTDKELKKIGFTS